MYFGVSCAHSDVNEFRIYLTSSEFLCPKILPVPRIVREFGVDVYTLLDLFFLFFTLQYCIGFCHTSTWICHGYTRVHTEEKKIKKKNLFCIFLFQQNWCWSSFCSFQSNWDFSYTSLKFSFSFFGCIWVCWSLLIFGFNIHWIRYKCCVCCFLFWEIRKTYVGTWSTLFYF